MFKLYTERMGERTLVGEYNDRTEVAKAKVEWITANGFSPVYHFFSDGSRVSSMWITSDGEEYEDFGSWSTYFVVVEEDEKTMNKTYFVILEDKEFGPFKTVNTASEFIKDLAPKGSYCTKETVLETPLIIKYIITTPEGINIVYKIIES